VEVTLDLRGPDLPEPNQLPGSPLSYKEFEEKYGASPEDAKKVEQVLKSYGLKIEEVSLGT
jgi:hypothetical protein